MADRPADRPQQLLEPLPLLVRAAGSGPIETAATAHLTPTLPADLSGRLHAWSDARPPDGFPSRPALRKHVRQGLQITQALAKHLGPAWAVQYWDERHASAKFVCWGCGKACWTREAHGIPPHPLDIAVVGEYRSAPLHAAGFGDFHPDDPVAGLDLPSDLVEGFRAWSADVDVNIEQHDEAWHRELDRRGEHLAHRLAAAAGPGRTVRYLGL